MARHFKLNKELEFRNLNTEFELVTLSIFATTAASVQRPVYHIVAPSATNERINARLALPILRRGEMLDAGLLASVAHFDQIDHHHMVPSESVDCNATIASTCGTC